MISIINDKTIILLLIIVVSYNCFHPPMEIAPEFYL